MALRRELHSRGLRYRIQTHVPGNRRRRIDIAFTRVRVAVMVDGCFWHGCPEHGTRPVANRDWWDWKIARNTERDRDTDRLLAENGWTVVRVWEHENPSDAANRVEAAVRRRRP
jgi:DNA mismatch endonuclease (patch repair protein)